MGMVGGSTGSGGGAGVPLRDGRAPELRAGRHGHRLGWSGRARGRRAGGGAAAQRRCGQGQVESESKTTDKPAVRRLQRAPRSSGAPERVSARPARSGQLVFEWILLEVAAVHVSGSASSGSARRSARHLRQADDPQFQLHGRPAHALDGRPPQSTTTTTAKSSGPTGRWAVAVVVVAAAEAVVVVAAVGGRGGAVVAVAA